jgi:hypothetical protein
MDSDRKKLEERFVIVTHPPLEHGDDEAVDIFERRLAEGFKKWKQRNHLNLEEVSERLSKTIVEQIKRKAASLVTRNAVFKIHGGATEAEGKELVEYIQHQLSRFVRVTLTFMSGLPRRGRRREFASRDRQIYEMHRKGNSYGKIARALNISRHAVQAAYRRERKRREQLCQSYPRLKQLFGQLGIVLKEENTPHTRTHTTE